ncbi:TauD/TfdA family dioxygenase [Nocardia sp. BMG51109]|uniref:TauD/TfdA dioxygenase family protein n=1 Tax=Nocardia sp. BMG51109 TaxID=1056816 RepID=UPI0004660F45|nr:TauD/TfdA family dioxygenase [Nocardia sp. BMG51109]
MRAADIAPAIGSRVTGVRLDRLGPGEFDRITRLVLDRHVVCLEGQQNLDPSAHLAFARRLGTVEEYPFGRPLDGYPGIFRIIKERDSSSNFGGVWHTDSPYHEVPPAYTVLRGVDIPERGGDTLVASMCAAYDALPGDVKERIEDLDGVFTASKVHGSGRATNFSIGDVARIDDRDRADRTFAHPLVRRHPQTGRKGLYVSACHMSGIVGLPPAEAERLIAELSRHLVDDRFTGRIRWSAGLVVVIDNRCVQHHALNDYHGRRREIHRVLVSDGRAPSRELRGGAVDAISH